MSRGSSGVRERAWEMEREEQRETLTLGKRTSLAMEDEDDDDDGEEEKEEREIEDLEREVSEMAQKIVELRRTMPDRLVQAFSSHLIAQRPEFPHPEFGSTSAPSDLSAQAGTSGDPGAEMREQSELTEGTTLAEADQVLHEKLRNFREKTARNIATMPVILTRMNECIARIDKLEQYNVNIHSVFKKKRK